MALDPVSLGIAAGTSVLGPVVAKGIGSLFGLDEPSEEERRAAAQREDAIRRLKEQAEGRTASPAELMARQQQQRTIQALSSLAARGTAQQQAGAQRAAMQAAPEVMAQQGATAAAARAGEMERARNALAQTQMLAAQQEAAQGRANREYMQRLVGAGVQGAAGLVGQMAMQKPEAEAPAKQTWGGRMQELELQSGKSLQAPMLKPQSAATTGAAAPVPAAPQTAVSPTSMAAAPAAAPIAVQTTPTVAPTLGKRLPSAAHADRFLGRLYDGEADYGVSGGYRLGRGGY